MFIYAKILIFSRLASLATLAHITVFYQFQFKKKDKSNVQLSCSPDGYLIQRTPRGTLLVRKLNLGPNMPLPLTQSSNTNTSYLLLQLYRYTKSECCIFIRTKKCCLVWNLLGQDGYGAYVSEWFVKLYWSFKASSAV